MYKGFLVRAEETQHAWTTTTDGPPQPLALALPVGSRDPIVRGDAGASDDDDDGCVNTAIVSALGDGLSRISNRPVRRERLQWRAILRSRSPVE